MPMMLGQNEYIPPLQRVYSGTELIYEERIPVAKFICVGERTGYSEDGASWTQVSTISSKLKAIAFGNGRFVTVGEDGISYSSTDGENWTAMTGLNTSYDYEGVTYGGDRFVAVGGAGRAYYSTDGKTWVYMSGLRSTMYMNDVAYGNGKFVAVGILGNRNWGSAHLSTDGISWKEVGPVTYPWGVAFGNGKFVMVSEEGSAYYSTNGTSWTSMSGLDESVDYKSVTYGDGMFVCCGTGYTLYKSTNGTSWTCIRSSDGSSTSGLYGITYGNGKFVAVGYSGISYYTTGSSSTKIRGLNINYDYYGIAYGAN